jgi:uncharacterized membrane protein YfcA
LTPLTLAALAAIVALAFAVEAALGFGATLIALALGSLVTSTDAVLAASVPLNLLLSLSIVAHDVRAVDARVLFGRLLPAMALGFPIGLVALERLPRSTSQLSFAAFMFALATAGLVGLARRREPGPMSPWRANALLVLGGVAHGAFASGGPPAVYVGARALGDKTAFRATVSALWLVLNGALVVAYVVQRRVTGATLLESAVLAPGLLVGLAVGQALHGRMPERAFRAGVLTLLLAASVLIASRA